MSADKKAMLDELMKEAQEMGLYEIIPSSESGFFDLPSLDVCNHPEHRMPTHIWIPVGKGYRHVCPACGHVQVELPEPLFWYRPIGNDGLYEGPVHSASIGGKMMREEKPGQWAGLFTADQMRQFREEGERDVMELAIDMYAAGLEAAGMYVAHHCVDGARHQCEIDNLPLPSLRDKK